MKLLPRICVFLLFLLLVLQVRGSERKKILVLHSYHPSMQWTLHINQGIALALDSVADKIDVDYQYLDTKRNDSEEYRKRINDLYAYKLMQRSYDVAIVVDNNALDFVKKFSNTIFKNTPIVFCGINSYLPQLATGIANITGVAENIDWEGNIQLIHKITPKVKNIAIINDNKTTTAKINKKELKNIENKYLDRFKFIYYEDYSYSDLIDVLRTFRGDTAVFMLTFNIDRDNQFVSFRDNAVELFPNCKVPVYVPWSFYLTDNVVGGKVIYGKTQGEIAAKMALEILAGKSAADIPVYTNPADKYVLNYEIISKLNFDTNKLPSGAVFFNRPKSFYAENRWWLLTIFIVAVTSAVVILVLVRAVIRRRIAEKALKEEQKQLEITVRQEQMLNNVGSLLSSTENFNVVIKKILHLLKKELSIENMAIISFQNGADYIVAQTSSFNITITEIEGLLGRLKENKRFVVSNLANVSNKELLNLKAEKYEALMAYPIATRKKVFGAIICLEKKTYDWLRNIIPSIQAANGLIAGAWERDVLIEDRIAAEQKNMETLRMLEESSRLASVGVIAAGITHEINQPLNTIKITADSILFWEKRNQGKIPEFFARKIQTISEGTARIDSIIKHMRKFWEKPQIICTEKVNLITAVQSGLSLIKRQIYDHSITLETNFGEEPVFVTATHLQIEQIVINIIVNAIYSLDNSATENKIIKINVHNDIQYGILEIHDNGTGIDAAIQEQIYDPLFTTKSPEYGTGLGMAIVKSFLDRISGKIINYNNNKGGATFVIYFLLYKNNDA